MFPVTDTSSDMKKNNLMNRRTFDTMVTNVSIVSLEVKGTFLLFRDELVRASASLVVEDREEETEYF